MPVVDSRWLYDVCRGGDVEPVKERHIAQSVGCSKNFRGPSALDTKVKVRQWLECLAKELVDRLSKDKQMVGISLSFIYMSLMFCLWFSRCRKNIIQHFYMCKLC